MSRTIQRLSAVMAASLLAAGLAGCGAKSTEVADASTAAAAPPPAASYPSEEDDYDSEDGGEPTYGGETYGGESTSASSGGGGGGMGSYADQMAAANRGASGGGRSRRSLGGETSNGGYSEEDQMAGYGGEESYDDYGGGYPGGGMAAGGEDMYGAGYAGAGYGDEEDGLAGPGMGGYGGPGMGGYGGPGMGGPGMGGPGGNEFAQVRQFVNQTCVNCHGPRQAKGDVRLDGLTASMDDPLNAALWNEAVAQLEAGTMPPQNAGRVNPQQKQMVIDWVRKALEESGAAGGVDYLALAKRTFGMGKEGDAIKYLQAYAITADEEEAKEVLSKTKWFAAGTRPTTTLRFGVGVVLDAPSSLTDVKPIGTSQMGGGGGFGGGMGRGMGAAGDSAPREFYGLTGDFGSALVGSFESRWTSGEYGSVFNEVVAVAPAVQPGAGGFGGSGRGFGGMGGMAGGGDMYGGGYGGAGAGYGGGGYGGEDGGGYGGPAGGSSATADRKPVMPNSIVTPGLVYLGDASQKELLEKATELGLDAIFVFDVDASHNRRTNLVNNETRLRLMTVDGSALAATNRLSNTEIERAKLRGTDNDDEVQKNVDRLFTLTDEKLALGSLQDLNLKPEHAKNRLRQLLAQREALDEEKEAEMNLDVLYETRLFHSMGLINDDDMSTVYQIVFEGNEGISLATGTVEDRRLVVEDLL